MLRIISLSVLCIAMSLQAQLSLENIWNTREYSPKYVSGFHFLNDGVSYCKLVVNDDNSQSCEKYDAKTGNKLSTIFSTATILVDDKPIRLQSYELSEDENKVLLSNGFESVYRHSGKSNVWLYDLKTKTLNRISDKKVMYATLSPDGKKVAYVSDNNLFYFDLEKAKDVQVTFDGKKNEIINGAVDWVYEEEFSMSKGFQWSPDGSFIAYYRFDESKVKEFGMDLFGSLYPEREVWKYPKAGEDNSRVDVYIHKIGKKKSVLCETGSENDQYLPRIKWMSANYVSVQRLNRLQNKMELIKYSYYYPKGDVLYTETNEKYIEVVDWIFTDASDPKQLYQAYFTSEQDGYNQIYGLGKDGKAVNLSNGKWDVDQLLGVSEMGAKLLFTSGMNAPTKRHVYGLDIAGKAVYQLSRKEGWHTVVFSDNSGYYMDYFSTITTPAVITLNDLTGEVVRVLEDNKELKEKLSKEKLGEVSFGSFKTTENVELDYWKILPPDFDLNKKYPVLFFVYGGPGYQTVKNQWLGSNYLWYQYMAQKGYIVISVDNRGSGGRGEAFKKVTYLNLGKYETKDYIEAAKYFGAQTYIDKARIGIFGWSYGGFMASNCISIGADYFKTAVAVAPVTNWRYYDNIYTERYMRTPQENASGYDDNSPINHIDKIKGNYLIVHGTADDNVHFQNSAEMVMAMNAKNIPYDAAYYPNTNHGIHGGKIRWHLFTKISKFITDNL
ncbi:MAG: alpha/beta fold hydrolase [Bacteroidia bacterium]